MSGHWLAAVGSWGFTDAFEARPPIQSCARPSVRWTYHSFPIEHRWQHALTSLFLLAIRKKAGIRIKRVLGEHLALHAFCQTMQRQLKLKFTYCSKSKSALCHKLIQLLLVRKRGTTSDEAAQQLLETQGGRCAQFGDLLSNLGSISVKQ